MPVDGTIQALSDLTNLSDDPDVTSPPANAVEIPSSLPSTGNPQPSELPDTSITSSAGKALSPVVATPILEALHNVVNMIPDLAKLVRPGTSIHSLSTLQHRLEYWQTGRVFLQQQSAHSGGSSWQNLAEINTAALEIVYNLEIEPNQAYVFRSRDGRDLEDGNIRVDFSRLVLEKTSTETYQKGKIFVDVSFQIRKKRRILSRAISKVKKPFSRDS
jgi:hypothetical protein